MAKKTVVKPDGTQVTHRTQDVVSNIQEKCQAIVTTQVVICEPMTDGTWRLVTSFQDNYNIILAQREHDAARQEVVGRLQEIKQQWQDKGLIISLENLLTTGRPSLSKTEGKTKLPAPRAGKTS